ncbi:MATE family efflux transporter [Paraclostridium sordellii]|uniref:MATE family efflux transporter n=1 Tax=Paraclostridium sordellii TaxID=1505 RepID=UPI0005DFE690|nr:MATE family efflux transporter [Paeniclostridium sordellii]CEN24819.1 multidrug efflux protein [[Clostridium] sordellii] [Paeniclostridium sordellii]
MSNSLENKISLTSLIKYTFPTVVMMVFFSLSTIIDGIFISRYVGANALSATNIVYPVINILIGVSVMFATGGNAIVAKFMGEGKNQEAKETFTLITLSALTTGLIVAVLSIIFIKNIIYALGSTDSLYKNCYDYLVVFLVFAPVMILKLFFDYFLVTAGVPKLGLISSVSGGVINIILDYLFIVEFKMGALGAALATCISYALPAMVGVIYFSKKSNVLCFVKPKFNIKLILDSCMNGSSEMVTQMSGAVTTFLYNAVMLKFLGEDGVASITIILYVQYLLNSAYIGFTSGVSPRISYNYGSRDDEQLRKIVRYSFTIVSVFAVFIFISSRSFSNIIIGMFSPKGTALYDITFNGFMVFSFNFLVVGTNIFTSGMFTAFSNGKISAMLSILRTFILFTIGIITLPSFLGINGVWMVVPFAEFTTFIVSIIFINRYKKIYMYGKKNESLNLA